MKNQNQIKAETKKQIKREVLFISFLFLVAIVLLVNLKYIV